MLNGDSLDTKKGEDTAKISLVIASFKTKWNDPDTPQWNKLGIVTVLFSVYICVVTFTDST